MTDKDIEKVKEFLRTNENRFYTWKKWRRVRAEVLKMDHNECQMCKAQNKRYVSRAYVVHHVHKLKSRPDLALEIWDENGERNLISVCSECHNKLHPEKLEGKRRYTKRNPKGYINQERW